MVGHDIGIETAADVLGMTEHSRTAGTGVALELPKNHVDTESLGSAPEGSTCCTASYMGQADSSDSQVRQACVLDMGRPCSAGQ